MILFTRILGIALVLFGVIGLFQNPLFGVFDINATHAIITILSGVIGLGVTFVGKSYVRLFLIVFGILWALAAIIGFVNNGDILGLLTTNRADDYFHAAVALVSLGFGFRD